MRTTLFLASTFASLAVLAACATSEEVAPPAAALPPTTLSDAAAPDGEAADMDAPDTALPACSSAGWCVTSFPDPDLAFRDIWPLDEHAFAIAESRLLGVKVLEWKKSTDTWEYIDDQTQNDTGAGTFGSSIYAPNADEVYFAVGPSFIYHGKRPVSPETKWSWTRQKLPDNIVGHPPSHDHGNPVYSVAAEPVATLGVWGTDAENVYAYYSNTIFQRDPSDGSWAAVYTADDLESTDEHIYFTAVAGTSPDDMMFVGARERDWAHCPLIVRKVAGAWERIADGIVDYDWFSPCKERAGTMHIGSGGWLTDIQRISATEYIALHDQDDWFTFKKIVNLTRVRIADGGYSFEQSVVPVKNAQPAWNRANLATSLWRGAGENWFTSWGLVLRGTDDGTYTPSTISRDGAPVNAPFYKIRGTSNQNLWAIGARYAYHKTTP